MSDRPQPQKDLTVAGKGEDQQCLLKVLPFDIWPMVVIP